MENNEYRSLYKQLNRYSDVKRIAQEQGIDRELLFVIYTQRHVRSNTRTYYQVKAQAPKLLKRWKQGSSFNNIAFQQNFSPVLLAFLLLKEDGVPRKKFWRWVRGEEKPPTDRLKREIRSIRKTDLIYSPRGMKLQEERGKEGERRLQEWLDSKELVYKTEEELRGESQKTPDALLDKPYKHNGVEYKWFESKANFGDKVEVRKNARQQLLPYAEIFGPGVVVYWFGFVEEAQEYDDILIVDRNFFD